MSFVIKKVLNKKMQNFLSSSLIIIECELNIHIEPSDNLQLTEYLYIYFHQMVTQAAKIDVNMSNEV